MKAFLLSIAVVCAIPLINGQEGNLEQKGQVLEQFSKAYTGLDSEGVKAAFGKMLEERFLKQVARWRKEKASVEMVIDELSDTGPDSADGMIQISVNGEIVTSRRKASFFFAKENGSLVLAKLVDHKIRKMNKDSQLCREMRQRLIDAMKRRDRQAISGMFADQNLPRQLEWLKTALDQGTSVRSGGATRRGGDFLCRFEVAMPRGSETYFLIFEVQDDDTGLFSLPREENRIDLRLRQVSDFWSAIERADRIALVSMANTGSEVVSARIQQFLGKAGLDGKNLVIPKEMAHRFRSSGRYLIPVVKDAAGLLPAGKHIAFPMIPGEHELKHYADLIFGFKSKAAGERKEFVRSILARKDCREIHKDSLEYLTKRPGNVFREKLNDDDLAFWREWILGDVGDPHARMLAMQEIGKHHFAEMESMFVAALLQKELSSRAASILKRHNEALLKAEVLKMLESADNKQMGIQLSRYLKNDPEVSKRIAELSKSGDVSSTQALPQLLAEGNEEGEAQVKAMIFDESDPRKFIRVMRPITHSKDKRFAEAVRKRLAGLDRSKPESLFLYQNGFPYLCSIRDEQGIEMAIEFAKTLKEGQLEANMFSGSLVMVARKRFKSLAECIDWLESLKGKDEK